MGLVDRECDRGIIGGASEDPDLHQPTANMLALSRLNYHIHFTCEMQGKKPPQLKYSMMTSKEKRHVGFWRSSCAQRGQVKASTVDRRMRYRLQVISIC